MTRRSRIPRQTEPRELEVLTQRQADLLRLARDTDGGCFIGISFGKTADELVEGRAATWREHRYWTDTTRSSSDPTPIGWLTETYLVPTELGLRLLEKP